MDLGLIKSFALYLPILAFAVWEVVKLGRDPELKRDREESSGDPRHTERE